MKYVGPQDMCFSAGHNRSMANIRGILAQLNTSGGGMPKLPIREAMVSVDGVKGDWQKNRKYHGGPNRAICIYSEEFYEWLREQGVNVTNGNIGENFTTQELDLLKLKKGDRLKVGQCIIEITDVRVPCYQLKKWDVDLPELIVGRSGWVAKVVKEGMVKEGDEIVVE
jgi:MOSC domain-containing protein YiiM